MRRAYRHRVLRMRVARVRYCGCGQNGAEENCDGHGFRYHGANGHKTLLSTAGCGLRRILNVADGGLQLSFGTLLDGFSKSQQAFRLKK